ncbi:unnamed protein product [Alternaria alternata]
MEAEFIQNIEYGEQIVHQILICHRTKPDYHIVGDRVDSYILASIQRYRDMNGLRKCLNMSSTEAVMRREWPSQLKYV